MNKFVYLFVVQSNYGYGHGFEDSTQSESQSEMYADLRAYRDNAPEYAHRLIERREVSSLWLRARMAESLRDLRTVHTAYLTARERNRSMRANARIALRQTHGSEALTQAGIV